MEIPQGGKIIECNEYATRSVMEVKILRSMLEKCVGEGFPGWVIQRGHVSAQNTVWIEDSELGLRG
jgi:hypothetical protein